MSRRRFRHFPSRYNGEALELYFPVDKLVDGKPPITLTERQERALIRLLVTAHRLLRIRKAIKTKEERRDAYRDKILSLVPDGVYGFIVHGTKYAMDVTMSRRAVKTISGGQTIRDFLDYLGPENVDAVVRGFMVPLLAVLRDPDQFWRFVELMQENFGADSFDGVKLSLDRQALDKLIKDGVLEPADDFFQESTEGSVSVLVKLAD